MATLPAESSIGGERCTRALSHGHTVFIGAHGPERYPWFFRKKRPIPYDAGRAWFLDTPYHVP